MHDNSRGSAGYGVPPFDIRAHDIRAELEAIAHAKKEASAAPVPQIDEDEEVAADEAAEREDAQYRADFLHFLGPIRDHFENSRVQNIDVNADGAIFVESFGKGVELMKATMPKRRREALLAFLANHNGRSIDHLHARLQCDLPFYGSRVQAFAPPVSNWAFTIRLHGKNVIALEDYVETGTLSQKHYDVIVAGLEEELNFVTAGSVNAGKTMLMNSLLDKKGTMMPDQRIVVIQDRAEVRVDRFANNLIIMTRLDQAHNESNGSVTRYTYDFVDALEDALRTRQDCLAWGEVRDSRSAYSLVMACNTGTKGFLTTLHADSAFEVLTRFEQLLISDGKTPVPGMISKVVHLVPFVERNRKTGRRAVTQLMRCSGVDVDGHYTVENYPTE